MEKICEFCTELRPVVYCKADTTHLCLSCDAKLVSTSCGSGDSSVVDFDIPRQPFSQIGGPSVSSRVNCATPVSNAGSEVGSSSQQSKDLKENILSFTFPQQEHLSSSSITSLPLNGESFWQCKSPIQTNLGVREELLCDDDLNIPDVDLTFQGFEELFGGDEDRINALLYDNMGKDIGLFYKVFNLPGSADCPRLIRSSYSTLSFFVSRCSAESSGTDCLDSGVSPYIRGEPSHNSPNLEGAHLDAREIAKMRYKEKKYRPSQL
ncbi:hypothetical protein I3843_06G015100 [Carya illinoinensis]|nr:hypothetical protein I3843_06G015100 [Carya illinoinensis]